MLDGRRVRLGRPEFVAALHGQAWPDNIFSGSNQTLVALGDEQTWLSAFLLGDQLRPDAQQAVARLKQLGIKISLLSGDGVSVVQGVAEHLNIAQYAGQLLPQDKLDRLRELQAEGEIVAMVGDGVNDAPVLAAAQVSIAMGQGAEVAQASADMVMMNGQLERLADAILVARQTAHVIRQNLWWAAIYNVAAIPAAALGMITPWMAGIGMSASSLLVVLNALRLSRAPHTSRVAQSAPALSGAVLATEVH